MFKVLCSFLVGCLIASAAQAQENQPLGRVYPVVEPDIVAELTEKVHSIDLSRIEAEHEHYQPFDLHKLPRAKENKQFNLDMTYTLDRNLIDDKGTIIYPQGYTFNPLNHFSLPGGIIVLDASDPQQLEWFKSSPYINNPRTYLLLSDGYAAELRTSLKRPVYYFTHEIAKRLTVQAVPAIIIEREKHLVAWEVYLEKTKN